MSYIFNRENYELAKVNGDVDRFRGDEISRRIAKEVPLSEQIAILMDKDAKPEKFTKYQALRNAAIVSVDEDIKGFETT